MPHMDVDGLVDPDIADVFAGLPRIELDDGNLAEMRRPSAPDAVSASVRRSDGVVPGDPDVRIRIHRPAGATGALPCVLSMHGGAYVFGGVSMDDALFDEWCPRLGIVGVSVDYRLAPETPYPGPLMDCYSTLKWIHENAPDLGIDPTCIGLHGRGAGGGLAAALAIVARDHREVPLAFQILDSPMIDDRQQTQSSRQSRLPRWSSRSTTFGWRAYLGDLHGAEDVPGYAAAARCVKLRRLPASFVSVGALDAFADEAIVYATRLKAAGIPTELHMYPGAPHCYQDATASAVARQASRDMTNWLQRRLASHQGEAPTGAVPTTSHRSETK